MKLARALTTVWLALLIAGAVVASEKETPAPYASIAPLIGEWNVGPAGAATAFVERFSWGPNRGYVRFSVSLLQASGKEHLHLDGMILWNAATRRFDYLLAVEPGSLAQEQGEFHRHDDGTIVRAVILTGADGSAGQFRQTFRALDTDRFDVALLRRTDAGWTPTFPGSDQLVMVRRAG